MTTARANTITLDWAGVNGNNAGGYYISPYTAQIDGTNNFITLYCIDFNHEVAPPYQWDATIQPLTLADVPNMQYGNSFPNVNFTWAGYEEAAWLITQLTGTTDPYQQDVFQYAAWSIFLDPSHFSNFINSVNSVGGAFALDVANADIQAWDAVKDGYTPTGWDVVTPDPAGQPYSTQEFLTPDTGQFAPVATPEPMSILLLGTALLGVVFLTRRHFDHKRAERK